MKAKVLPKDLERGLKFVKSAMPSKPLLPILHNILVEAGDQGLRLTGTDLELSASALVPGKTEEAGTITVPFKALEMLAKNLPNKPLEFRKKVEYAGLDEKADGEFALIQGSRKICLVTMDADDFPLIRVAEGKGYLDLDDLLDACRFVYHAIGKEYDARPALWYAEAKDGKLWASDGFRLAVAPGFEGECSFPRPLVNFLARQKEEPTKLVLDDKLVTIWFGDNQIIGQQYEGKFPDWEQVIPKSHEIEIELDLGDFLAKIAPMVKLKPLAKIARLQPKKTRLYMEITLDDPRGSYEDWIEASLTGKRELFAFDIYFLLDALLARKPHLKDGRLKLQIQSPNSPMVITDDQTKFVEVLMPMHISRNS